MKKENGKEQSIHLVQSGNHKIYQIIITGILVVYYLPEFQFKRSYKSRKSRSVTS